MGHAVGVFADIYSASRLGTHDGLVVVLLHAGIHQVMHPACANHNAEPASRFCLLTRLRSSLQC